MPIKRGSKRRAADKMGDSPITYTEERKPIRKNGTCKVGVCEGETACQNLENNTYTCLCPHDSQPPTPNGACPRNIVNGDPGIIPYVLPPSKPHLPNSTVTMVRHHTSNKVDGSPGRIPNVQPPSKSPLPNSTIQPEPWSQSNKEITTASISAGMAIIVIVIFVLFRRIKRARQLNEAGASPINLKHSLLMADRYAPNPQYSACSGSGVPILRKEDVNFLKEIGEGCFGKVFKGELLQERSEQMEIVAVKVLKENASKEAEEDFIREVEIMSAFRHPNILSLLGMVSRGIPEGTGSPMMVFEYMPHGDLAELLRAQKKVAYENEVPQLKQKHLLSIALQIASGMKYLAAQRFVHRDLACRNCLVAEGPVVKIADFGMSRDVYTCDYYKIGGSRLLPVRWMSPESVLYGRFTLESDIWSYGVVLWEIYSFGKQPYYGHTNEEAVKLILDGIMLIPPEDCPSLICELMKNCWKTEPRDRIKFPNICDKLELAYDSFSEGGVSVHYEKETKNSNNRNTRSLPRPPPLKMISQEDLLDVEGYLLAKEIKEPVQYLETLPD